MAYDFPNSPSTGDQFVAPIGVLYVYDGVAWTTRGDTLTNNPFQNTFRYRTIYTRGYVSCGYQNSTPWRNVNRTIHVTDTTTNLGDIMDYTCSYVNGSWSDYNHYVYGNGSQAVGGFSTYTSSINMSTETNRSNSSAWHTTYSRGDTAVLLNANLTMAYVASGGTSYTDKHNMVTDTMYNTEHAIVLNGPAGGGPATGFFGATKGWVSTGATANLTFSTETWTSGGFSAPGNDGHGKSLSSKHGIGYVKLGSYASSTTLRKYNDTTGANISDTYSPDVSGEENFQVGQNWGYCLGNYNGAQNNNTYRVNYFTDAVTALGSTAQPKGHGGMSSGCCGSASAFLLGGPV